MATKTITIDLEAYDRLKSVQTSNESFSQTIKRVVSPRLDVESYLYRISRTALSPAAVSAVREHVEARQRPGKRIR
jgi:predicted CopG family antitoxin